MARGRAVIASLTHGARDILATDSFGETPYGVVADVEKSALAQAIETMLDDEEKMRRMGENAQRKAEQQYRWFRVSQEMTKVYYSSSPTRSNQGQSSIKQIRQAIENKWDELINRDLQERVELYGIEPVENQWDMRAEGGIVWFPNKIKYKILDGSDGRIMETRCLRPPAYGNYMVQYNESRGVARADTSNAINPKAKDCPFCLLVGDPASQFILHDFQGSL